MSYGVTVNWVTSCAEQLKAIRLSPSFSLLLIGDLRSHMLTLLCHKMEEFWIPESLGRGWPPWALIKLCIREKITCANLLRYISHLSRAYLTNTNVTKTRENSVGLKRSVKKKSIFGIMEVLPFLSSSFVSALHFLCKNLPVSILEEKSKMILTYCTS